MWRSMMSARANDTTAIRIQAGSPETRHAAAPASTPTVSPATPIIARRRRPPIFVAGGRRLPPGIPEGCMDPLLPFIVC